jgi:glycerophosphoryl diester phosphodiesterase
VQRTKDGALVIIHDAGLGRTTDAGGVFELYPGIENDILQVLGQENWQDAAHAGHRLIIQSFSADSVRAVHAQCPDLKTGFLGTPPVTDLPAYAAFTDQINPDYATISADCIEAVQALRGAHGARFEAYVWTVNDAATARSVAGYGVDGIITNHPDTVAAALGTRASVCTS